MGARPWQRGALLAAVLASLLGSGPAAAEASKVSATGFVVEFREEVQATPEQAWRAITQLPQWWNDQHTWSGKAANMSLVPEAGGCWCERWGDGQSVQHGQVVLVQPGRVLRLFAALGPLQELAVSGVLTLATGLKDGRTLLRITYRVSGSADAGLEGWAPKVDAVIGEQFRRLKALAERAAPGPS